MTEGIHTDPNPAPGAGKGGIEEAGFKGQQKIVQRAKRLRDNWEGIWNDIYYYVMPEREDFSNSRNHNSSRVEGEARGQAIFDETALVENPRFVGRIVNGMFPQGNRAFRLKVHPSQAKNQRKAQQELDALTDFCHEALRNSNFHNEIHEAVTDLSVGTMTLNVQPGQFPGDLKFTALPQTQVYLIAGPFGRPGHVIRERRMELGHIKTVWKKAEFTDEMERALKEDSSKQVITWEVVSEQFDMTGTPKFKRTVSVKEFEHVMVEDLWEGDGSNENITTRWMADAGETYGRGVLVQALPAIKTANLTVEMILEAGQWALGGFYTYDDDGVFNFDNVTIEPGTFVPRAPGSTIDALPSAANFNVSDLVLEDMRNNIRRALFSSAPDRPQGRTPPTATEIAEDRADTARNMGAAVARIQTEFLVPLVKRMLFIFKQQGIEVPMLDGRNVILVPESPLVRSQDNEDIANVMRYGESLQFLLGPEMAVGAQNPAELVPWLAERYRVPHKLVPSGNEIDERIRAGTQAAAQLSAGEAGPAQG